METNQQGTAKNRVGQTVELGRPHQPLETDPKVQKGQTVEKIDMNPGEPPRPYVGGDEPKKTR
jgi:hypothetical protein